MICRGVWRKIFFQENPTAPSPRFSLVLEIFLQKKEREFKKTIDKPIKMGYNTACEFMQPATRMGIWRCTQVGRRGAPAKGVGRYSRRESSNLSISARQKGHQTVSFLYLRRDLNASARERERCERRRGRMKRAKASDKTRSTATTERDDYVLEVRSREAARGSLHLRQTKRTPNGVLFVFRLFFPLHLFFKTSYLFFC